MKQFTIDQYTVTLGENAKENWNLSFSSNPNSTWIHLESFPSSHVIIQEEKPPNSVIVEAGLICKQHSKFKNLKNLKISCTLCSNLKKGSKPGEVYFKSNRKVKQYSI